ncbi:hypothetical protein AMTR_s00156p00043680 [Amborella trichopoda]|uniref:Uncharacterized protein n=1 Tax=Amborella trichopoda TaxID=13333 RepID=W1PKN0_AMBTC|nr:hypothetical protein AMTR_s00156p00043680 [Amborella trichopoda]
MERNEPALVPEWLKGSTGGGSGSGGATHHSSLSSLSDEASGTISTRSRSSGIGVGDHDNPRFPNFMDRTSVLHGRRSSSSNSVHDKDISTYSRLEEFAIKQSRQLIPMTPSMPKTLVLSPSEKPKPKVTSGATKVGQLPTSSPLLNSSLRGPTIRPDPQKPSQPGKLLVLKPSREKNGISSIPKESTSPSNPITRIANAPLTVIPAAPRNPKAASTDDKRPTSQAQNRSDFFNSLRKKTSSNLTPRPASMEKSDRENPITTVERTDEEARDCLAPEKDRAALPANGDAHEDCAGLGEESVKNQASNSVSIIVGSEEEEAAFLRSLGWEENAGEEALTEEEINAFYKEHMKLRPSTSLRRGACQLGSSAIKNA